MTVETHFNTWAAEGHFKQVQIFKFKYYYAVVNFHEELPSFGPMNNLVRSQTIDEIDENKQKGRQRCD